MNPTPRLRGVQIVHLGLTELGGLMYGPENLRIMSAMEYVLSSESPW